ncbi:hypothetical protein BDW71DRAFT_207425 [Aspergillus fruticulosus]
MPRKLLKGAAKCTHEAKQAWDAVLTQAAEDALAAAVDFPPPSSASSYSSTASGTSLPPVAVSGSLLSSYLPSSPSTLSSGSLVAVDPSQSLSPAPASFKPICLCCAKGIWRQKTVIEDGEARVEYTSLHACEKPVGCACLYCKGNKDSCLPLPTYMQHNVKVLRSMTTGPKAFAAQKKFEKQAMDCQQAYAKVPPETCTIMNLNEMMRELLNQLRAGAGLPPSEADEGWSVVWTKNVFP